MRNSELLDISIEAAAAVIRLVRPVGGAVKPLADQAIRAAGSVPLQVAEGEGHEGRTRQLRFRGAYAEAREATTAILVLTKADICSAGSASEG